MNKKLLVLLPIAMLALAGCNNPAEGGGEGGGGEGGGGEGGDPVTPEGNITINYENIQSFIPSGKTYPESPYEFLAGGVKFQAVQVGLAAKNSGASEGSYYNDNHYMQFRSSTAEQGQGYFLTDAPLAGVKKVTVHWANTRASQAAQYFPKVEVGDEATSLTVVNANEGTGSMDGAATGQKEKTYDAYTYTTTYNISGTKYIKVGAGNGAMYAREIIFEK